MFWHSQSLISIVDRKQFVNILPSQVSIPTVNLWMVYIHYLETWPCEYYEYFEAVTACEH